MNISSALKPSNNVLNRANGVVNQVEKVQNTYRKYSDIKLKQKTQSFLKRIKLGESVDDLIVEALATVREACYRVHGMFAYRTQLISALVIYDGNFAEMKTGEGKTLTIVLAAYIGALEQRGVHIVTVNEYLVKRDADFCRKALNFLGISVGFVTQSLDLETKKKMYACHVTYTTNSNLAFDYLRDNMVAEESSIMIPELNFAIIDEGDSILIDEAKTPLIISSPDVSEQEANNVANEYAMVDQIIKQLSPEDYKIDVENKHVSLQSTGIMKIERVFNIRKLYTMENSDLIHKIQNALVANFIMKENREYVIERVEKGNGNYDYEVIIVDQYTGRLLYGQTYNSGLHQAIQAKEYIKVKPENKTIASITYQSFFRMYKKIAALSGTGLSEEQEFSETYNMIVTPIPTYKPLIRKDLPDIIFGSKEAKIKGIVDEIKRHYITGQPVLVGTSSVYESELIYAELLKHRIPGKLLNAKNHYEEGEVISKAGRKHSVTIATNIAGRGVDIKIDEEVRKLGGLYVLGTDRNESRRIDNQLRGRSGRQGDPGKSIFFISLEDDIFKRFGGDRFEKLSKKMKDEYFDSKFISKTLTGIQKKIQSLNFEMRKNLIEYNEILSKQQQLIYKQRKIILKSWDNRYVIQKTVEKASETLIEIFTANNELKTLNIEGLVWTLNDKFFYYPLFHPQHFIGRSHEEIRNIIRQIFSFATQKKEEKYDLDRYLEVVQRILLGGIDASWQWHLNFATKLKENINLYSWEHKSPLNVYVEKIGEHFEETLTNFSHDVLMKILNLSNKSVGHECEWELKNILNQYSNVKESMENQLNPKDQNIQTIKTKLRFGQKYKQMKMNRLEELIENSHR